MPVHYYSRMAVRNTAARRAAEAQGRRAESLAAWSLRLKGWRILAQRVRTPLGEVDLIARRFRTLAFVEVKSRGSDAALVDAIDEARLSRVAAAAEQLLPRYARVGDICRIDVILVAPGRWPSHRAHVWMG